MNEQQARDLIIAWSKEISMSEQEARNSIIAWAKEHFAGKTPPDVSVVGIHYDAEFDVWDAKLSIWYKSTSVINPYHRYVTFTENTVYEHGIEVSQVEYS